MLCRYKDIFGEPYRGFHKTRIPFIDIALWDTIGTIAIIIFIIKLTEVNWLVITLLVLLITIFTHSLFCVETKLNKYLGLI